MKHTVKYYILFSASFLTGIILEIVNAHSNDLIVRGVIFIAIGVLLLIPSGKLNIVMYLMMLKRERNIKLI